jgi:hypothetical protein
MNTNLKRLLLAAALIPSAVQIVSAQSPMASKNAQGHRKETNQSIKLHQDMRKLWTDHVVWTRVFIIGATADAPDVPAATTRLLRNQEDIGKAVAEYYGPPAGEKLTGLLKSHIVIAGDLVKAAKANNQAGVAENNKKWEANADSIATMLSQANPNWPKPTLMGLLKGHLSTTTNEVKARLAKNWDQDVKAYDAVYDHILMLSDALSDGIVKQFPNRFTGQSAASR